MNPGISDNLTTRPSQTSVNKLPFLTPIGILFDPSHGGGFQGGLLSRFFRFALRRGLRAGSAFRVLPKAPALFPGLDDLAMVRDPVEQGRLHLSVAEHRRALRERQVRRDDYGRALVEPDRQVEQELAAGSGKGQVSKLVQNDQAVPDELLRKPPLPPVLGLSPEQGREQAHAGRGAGAQLPYIARRSLDRRPEQGGARLFRNHPGDHDPNAKPAQGVRAAGRRLGENVPRRWQVGIEESPCRQGKFAFFAREVQANRRHEVQGCESVIADNRPGIRAYLMSIF